MNFQTIIVNSIKDRNEASALSIKLNEYCADYDITKRVTDLTEYDYIPYWIKDYCANKIVRGCKDNTIKDYVLHLNDFFIAVHIPVNEITESDIVKYFGYCMKIKGNSNVHVEHKRIIINDFFKWSVKKKYLLNNPCSDIPPIKYSATKRVPYTDAELAKIRHEVTDVRDIAIIETLISTACRIEELCRLNIHDVDFESNEVFLFGKGDKHRVSFMNSEMKYCLKKYLDTRTDDNPALFVSKRINRHTKKLERITKCSIEAMTNRLSKSIGVNNIQPHRFRKTTATNLNKSGMKLNNIQKLLGHTNIETTMKYVYTDKNDLYNDFMKYNR